MQLKWAGRVFFSFLLLLEGIPIHKKKMKCFKTEAVSARVSETDEATTR